MSARRRSRAPHSPSAVMKSALPAGEPLTFVACLENWAEGMDYCAVAVPAEVTEKLGTSGPVLVLACVNDSKPFQVSLFPVGGGRHCIRIKAKVRKETNTRSGDRVRLRITRLDPSETEVPEDMRRALRSEGVDDAFEALPPGKRNFILRRVEEAVRSETRQKRIQEGVLAAHQRREWLSDRHGARPSLARERSANGSTRTSGGGGKHAAG